MTAHLLFDTNTVRPLYDAREPTDRRMRVEALVRENGGLTVAAFVEYEIRRGLEARQLSAKQPLSRRTLAACNLVLGQAEVLGLDAQRWRSAVALYAQSQAAGRALQESDLIVAATAIAHQRTLVTIDDGFAVNLKALGVAVIAV